MRNEPYTWHEDCLRGIWNELHRIGDALEGRSSRTATNWKPIRCHQGWRVWATGEVFYCDLPLHHDGPHQAENIAWSTRP
jgi:hypothetical protein